LKKYRTRIFTVPNNVATHRIVLDQDDVIPNRVIVALLDHRAFVGEFGRSPYKYKCENLTGIELTVDGVTVGKKLEVDFPNKNYAQAYAHTLASLGRLNSKKGYGISYEDFGNDKTVFAWCTATDLPNKDTENYFHLRRKACVALVLHFTRAIQHPVTVLATDEREDLLEIDLENRVKTVTGVV
jgi:hypothetical protein